MIAYLWIGLGSALGGIARSWISEWSVLRFGATFPWGTLAVNILGSFLIGVAAFLPSTADTSSALAISPSMRQIFMAGFCGGFTTFSSFSLQTLHLIREEEMLQAGVNIFGSVLLCLASVALGMWTATQFTKS